MNYFVGNKQEYQAHATLPTMIVGKQLLPQMINLFWRLGEIWGEQNLLQKLLLRPTYGF